MKNLSKTIGGKKIIDDVNLDLYPGQVTGFLGPNGAGKTTTIRMMAGLMKPTAGDVTIAGKSITSDFEDAMTNIGVIVENPEMYKYMSGYKNLLHFARMHKGVTKERIMEVVRQVGLENRINEKVGTYSLGMRQRLGLAQALLHNPKFLILDEPTNGLDPAGIREFRVYLRSLAEKAGVSVLVSSHMLSEIELMVDRVAVIQNGRLIDIREMKEETRPHHYVEAQPADRLVPLLKSKGYTPVPTGAGFIIEEKAERIPALVKSIVEGDLDLYAVRPYRRTLEDEFIEMTGGGQIAQTAAK